MIHRWSRIVSEKRAETKRYPNFSKFVQFVITEANIASDPIFGLDSSQNKFSNGGIQRRETFSLGVQDVSNINMQNDNICLFCESTSHKLPTCESFARETIDAKCTFILTKRLCFACLLASDHRARLCPNKAKCERCYGYHPTTLHGFNYVTKLPRAKNIGRCEHMPSYQMPVTSNSLISNNKQFPKFAKVIPVRISPVNCPSREIITYAFLDDGSDDSFISLELAQQLGTSYDNVLLKLTSATEKDKLVHSQKHYGLQIRPLYDNAFISIPSLLTREDLGISRDNIPTADTVTQFDHLCCLSGAIPPLLDVPIGLLFGRDMPEILEPIEKIEGIPFAVKTRIGWGVVGGRSTHNVRPCLQNLESSSKSSSALKICNQEVVTNKSYHEIKRNDFSEKSIHDNMNQTEIMFTRVDKCNSEKSLFSCTKIPSMPINSPLGKEEDIDSKGQFSGGLKHQHNSNSLLVSLLVGILLFIIVASFSQNGFRLCF